MASALEGLLEPTLAGMGYELVDLQVSNRGRVLCLFIDRPAGVAGGISLDDCADVSRHVARVLEVEGVDYDRMDVSSPGLDRPLRKPADFERFAGGRVEVKMRMPDALGRKRFTGMLKGAADGAAVLEVEGQDMRLRLDEMDKARLVPDLPFAGAKCAGAKGGQGKKGRRQ